MKNLKFLFFALLVACSATTQLSAQSTAPSCDFSKTMQRLCIQNKISLQNLADAVEVDVKKILHIARGNCPDKALSFKIANQLGQKLVFPDYDGDGKADDMLLLEPQLYIK